MTCLRGAWLVLPVLLSGCGYGASKLAHQAQISMIGMSQADLVACAGPPDKTIQLSDATQIFNYVYKPNGTGGFNLELPLNLGGVSLGGSGTYCSANIRVVNHRVSEVHYTGDDDKSVGSDGVCAPILRGCVRQPEPTMGPVKDNGASAFHSPAVPQQTTLGETITR
ncbi:hypothetical protein NFI95_09015 [Acetobacteraceae bacterium KSS8]|uniref:Lipoprotein n=1 Tax=Endosaccharibacter trunci TaxID=2812733 RepID=A0ABT1W6T0_9PROT|nr:hypothetical protein [Acetobacteraceae bacterium KSS8]